MVTNHSTDQEVEPASCYSRPGFSPGQGRPWITTFLPGCTVKLIFLLIFYKSLVLGLAFAYGHFWPESFSLDGFHMAFHRHEQPGPTERFTTWDGEHYLHLSEEGYKAGSSSDAFYPLWPAMIHAGAWMIGGHDMAAALILANIFSLVGLLLFHRLIAEAHGNKIANDSLILMIAYPGALFLQFPYSESLFLLLIMLFFIGLMRKNYWLVAFTGFVLPLTRATGVFCLLPLLWLIGEQAFRQATESHPKGFPFLKFLAATCQNRLMAVCLVPLLGYACYFWIMWSQTGNPLEGFAAQKQYINQPSIRNIVNLPGFIEAFYNFSWRHGIADSPIDRALFVIFLASLPLVWRLNKLYFFYAIGCGLVPAMSNWFVSYSRYLILFFPLFVVLAEKSQGKRWHFAYITGMFGFVQICFIIKHVNFRWAG
jgi:hypothetical protein